MSKDVTKDMTTGKPLLLILQFAFPLLIGNFFQQMYNVADAAIGGRFLGPKALIFGTWILHRHLLWIWSSYRSTLWRQGLQIHARLYLAQHFYHDCCRRPADNDLRTALPCYFTYFNHTCQHL